MSDRILVMSAGQLAGEMPAAGATQDSIMSLAVSQVDDALTADAAVDHPAATPPPADGNTTGTERASEKENR